MYLNHSLPVAVAHLSHQAVVVHLALEVTGHTSPGSAGQGYCSTPGVSNESPPGRLRHLVGPPNRLIHPLDLSKHHPARSSIGSVPLDEFTSRVSWGGAFEASENGKIHLTDT